MLSAEANFRQLKACLIAFNKEDVEAELLTGLHLQMDARINTHTYISAFTWVLYIGMYVCLTYIIVLFYDSIEFFILFG